MIDPRPYGVIGHRGARGLFAENTLDGFARTLSLGVRAIELDVALTADGVPVVVHDTSPNREIVREEGRWLDAPGRPFHKRTLASLAGLDVGRARPGGAVQTAYPDQAPCDGARIPSLAEALRLIVAAGATCWIELKSIPAALGPGRSASPGAMADAVVAVVRDLSAEPHVVMQAFDWRCQRRIRASSPELRLAWLTRDADRADWRSWFDQASADDPIEAVAANAGEVWVTEHVDLTPERIARAHSLGLHVVAWTVNDPDDMRRLTDWGVNGLITDRPDRALAISKATS